MSSIDNNGKGENSRLREMTQLKWSALHLLHPERLFFWTDSCIAYHTRFHTIDKRTEMPGPALRSPHKPLILFRYRRNATVRKHDRETLICIDREWNVHSNVCGAQWMEEERERYRERNVKHKEITAKCAIKYQQRCEKDSNSRVATIPEVFGAQKTTAHFPL